MTAHLSKGADSMTRPSITLTLTPVVQDGASTGVQVSCLLQGLTLADGDTLCRLPEVVVGVPGAKVASDGIQATDDVGPVPLTHDTDEPTPSVTFRRWRVTRETQGDITVAYVAPVRIVDAANTNGPLFDLRAEGQGISGAGMTFLALPDRDELFDTELQWDLSALPAGARGVTSHGEGVVRRTATMEALTYTFHMAGVLGSYPEQPEDTFGMFWLSPPRFDTTEVGRHSQLLYDQMCAFFREPAPGFRVFVRKHPFSGAGGSAMPGSRGFMFGWSEAEAQTTEELKQLLAHETVHNWPLLDGDPAKVSWYNEGTAEYYSLILNHRSGLIDDDKFLYELNRCAYGYYGNPLQTLTSDEAARRYWQDWRAQRIPYGRGLFYLIDANHKIQLASNGRRSLDDLVLEILDRHRAGQNVTVDDWLELIGRELGDPALADYEAMTQGRWILPAADCLAPRFIARDADILQLDVGFEYSSLRAGVIKGLVDGGPADQAGVCDGDIVLRSPAPHKLPQRRVAEITLTLQRGDDVFDVDYKPFGELVPGKLWEKTSS